jgi:hypothetical protein
MINHIPSGSWLSSLFIIGFRIAGVLAVLTALICLQNYPGVELGDSSNSNHIIIPIYI